MLEDMVQEGEFSCTDQSQTSDLNTQKSYHRQIVPSIPLQLILKQLFSSVLPGKRNKTETDLSHIMLSKKILSDV